MNNTTDKLNFFLTGKKTVGVAGHVRPDGDCVGSTLAVYNYVKECYPQVDVRLYLEPIPNIFKFLKSADEIRSDLNDKGIILMDTPEGVKWDIKALYTA